MQPYLSTTTMVDFQHQTIQSLITRKAWRLLPKFEAVKAVYEFVRDDIAFGYNRDDQICASQVLSDGYGQCNTKGTLLIALLRALGVPARVHGFTIFNQLQKGAIPSYLFVLAPDKILHSWVEIEYQGRWIELEGYIIDKAYLRQIQQTFSEQCDEFSGYGIATPCLSNPPVEWTGDSTYIQKEGIADDFGVYENPDEFYAHYGSNLTGLRKWLYANLFRHLINLNVRRIRNKG